MKLLKFSTYTLIAITGTIAPCIMNVLAAPTMLFNTIYYCLTNGAGGHVWTTVRPSAPLICASYNGCYCTVDVVTGYTPINNTQIPSADIAPGTTPVTGIYR